MATLEAIKDALLGEPGPPSVGTSGTQPLEEAIVGHWHGPVMKVTSSADGAASARTALGMIAGRWSIAGGKLHVTGMGQDIETDASVSGDVLSVLMDGKRLNFRRADSA